MLRLIAFGFCLLCFSPAHAQTAENASAPDLTPSRWEITAEMNAVSYGNPTAASDTGRGFSLRAGYRPTASRRGLLEVYGLHAPPGLGTPDDTPQINALGVMGTVLAREADKRINPYVGGGFGLWRVDAQTLPPCRPEDGCLDEGGYSFEDATALSAVVGAGLYLTVVPAVALRTDAKIYGPLAIGGDSGDPLPVFSIGLSVRP